MAAVVERWMGIDPSSDFGWAHGGAGEMPMIGVYKVAKGLSVSKRHMALEDFLISIITANGITDVYIERPILPKVTSVDALMSLMGYSIVTGLAATKCGISCRFIDMQTWRSKIGAPTQAPKMRPVEAAAVLGISIEDFTRGGEKTQNGRMRNARRQWVKQQTMAILAKLYGIHTEDDNEADAAGIWKAVEINRQREKDAASYDLFADLKV